MAKDLRSQKINRILYISIGVVIAAIILVLSIFFAINNKVKNDNINLQLAENSNSNEISSEQASTSIGKTVEESEEYEELESQTVEVEDEIVNNRIEETVNSEIVENGNEIVNEIENNENVVEEVIEDPVFTMPVEGEIMKQYGKEKLIYSETLKEWTTHLGIDIEAEKTTVVRASSMGVVKSIKNDPRYGLTIVIEHENGFSTVYSNLLSAEFVVVGENVESGQTIGTVGTSATFEILDDPHLHFEILKDGNSVDPEMYIK